MAYCESTSTGAPFAAAAVLCLTDGKLTSWKHNYVPALANNVSVEGDQ
jgi:hypothetical protein